MRAAVPEPDPVLEALDAALGTVIVVSKRRRLFLGRACGSTWTKSSELGSFIEFEAVLPDAGDLATAHDKLARLRSSLGIEDGALVSVGYADLLMDGPQALLRAADAAMRNAYAKYSEFKVGAAVRGRSGAIYAGANVENSAYPQGQCAEASALGALVTAGETAITGVAVVADRLDAVPAVRGLPPAAGRVRGARIRPYIWAARIGEPRTVTLGDLLPRSFGREALERVNLGAPRVGVVLGSGLGAMAEAVEDAVVVSYEELPGFPRPSVAGHAGRAVLGSIGGVPVAVLQGRAHLYEGGDPEALRVPIRALRAAGASILVLTNAAGSLHPAVGPGSLMAITDHINLTGVNLLIGSKRR